MFVVEGFEPQGVWGTVGPHAVGRGNVGGTSPTNGVGSTFTAPAIFSYKNPWMKMTWPAFRIFERSSNGIQAGQENENLHETSE